MKTIITTRHSAMAEYLIASGIAPPDAEYIPRATAEQITGCRVIGPLPIELAALASSWVHVPVDMTGLPRDHGLTREELAARIGPPAEYVLRTLPLGGDPSVCCGYPRSWDEARAFCW